jgi:type II secretory pathway component PulL
MVDCEKEEALNLQKEFEWVLHQEVHKGLEQIHQILTVSYRSSPEVY